jgi:hypothetical protein
MVMFAFLVDHFLTNSLPLGITYTPVALSAQEDYERGLTDT